MRAGLGRRSILLTTSSTGTRSPAAAPAPRGRRRRSARPRRPAAPRRRRRAPGAPLRFSRRLSAPPWRVWKPGVSTKTNCASGRGQDAGDAVARGLRLARRDADLLPDQRVQQRRLADVRPADDGDRRRSETRRVAASSSCLQAARRRVRAASCSAPRAARAARRRCGASSSCDDALDLERLLVRLALRGDHAVLRQRECGAPAAIPAAGSWRPCPAPCGSSVVEQRPRTAASTTSRAASKPPSRKTAPISASSASARIDGRRTPPLLSSPSPRRR